MLQRKWLVIIAVTVVVSSCAGLTVINTKKLTKQFCVISKKDLICYKKEGDKDPVITTKYSGVCKDYDNWVLIPMETFQRISN